MQCYKFWCVSKSWSVRSGTVEQYTELAQLLEDIRSYQNDYDLKEKTLKKKKRWQLRKEKAKKCESERWRECQVSS